MARGLVSWIISADQRSSDKRAEPIGDVANDDTANATQEMESCDSKRDREVGIDKVNGASGEVEMRRGNERSWVWWWSYRFL